MATEEILNSDFSPEEKDAILKEKIQKCGEYKKKLSSLNERYGLEVVHEKKMELIDDLVMETFMSQYSGKFMMPQDAVAHEREIKKSLYKYGLFHCFIGSGLHAPNTDNPVGLEWNTPLDTPEGTIGPLFEKLEEELSTGNIQNTEK